MKPKTIRDFLLTIEDEKIRTEAIENATKEDAVYLDMAIVGEGFDLARAIRTSFTWSRTPINQGHHYWKNIFDQAEANTLKTREIE